MDQLPQAQTMTSLEIAELTGKRHDHVLRDIRSMVSAFKKEQSISPKLGALIWVCESATYTDGKGREKPMFRLDKATTITLLSGYDVVARHKIVTRWEQLEAGRTGSRNQRSPATAGLYRPQ